MSFVWFLVGFAAMVVFASFFEWTLHRFVLHRPLWFFRYPFNAHAMVHHRAFRADRTYHVQNRTDEANIPMAWWNGPALILLSAVHGLGSIYFMVVPTGRLRCRLRLLHNLRIFALVHAQATTSPRGAFRNLLRAQWPSSAAPPLHAQEFRRCAAARRPLPKHPVSAFQGLLRPGARRSRARCTTPSPKRYLIATAPGRIIRTVQH